MAGMFVEGGMRSACSMCVVRMRECEEVVKEVVEEHRNKPAYKALKQKALRA